MTNAKNALLRLKQKLRTDLVQNQIGINNIVIGYEHSLPMDEQYYERVICHPGRDLAKTIALLTSGVSHGITGQDIFLIGDRILTTIKDRTLWSAS